MLHENRDIKIFHLWPDPMIHDTNVMIDKKVIQGRHKQCCTWNVWKSYFLKRQMHLLGKNLNYEQCTKFHKEFMREKREKMHWSHLFE